MLVVADSSPLICLSRIGVLDVLASAFGEVFVPAVVWTEVATVRSTAPGVAALHAAKWLRVDGRALPAIDLGLDPGETAAILLAEALHADLVLIDERAGRITFAAWHDGSSWTFRGNAVPMAEDLAILVGDPAAYCAYAADYFEVDVPLAAVAHVLAGGPLDAEVLGTFACERTLAELEPELAEIGYGR